MKHLYSLFVLFPLFSLAQWQVSVGAQKGLEWHRSFSEVDGLFSIGNLVTPSYNSQYWSDHYMLNCAYSGKKNLIELSLSYLQKSHHLTTRSRSDSFDKDHTEWFEYDADVKYSYVGLGISLNKEFRKNNFSFLVGGKLFCDVKISNASSNQVKRWYNQGPNSNSPVVVNLNSGADFNMLSPYSLVVNLGPSFSFKYYFKSVFLELPVGVGVVLGDRLPIAGNLLESTQSNPYYYFNYGIRLGYIFNKKVKE